MKPAGVFANKSDAGKCDAVGRAAQAALTGIVAQAKHTHRTTGQQCHRLSRCVCSDAAGLAGAAASSAAATGKENSEISS
jgi:hypothetical protein